MGRKKTPPLTDDKKNYLYVGTTELMAKEAPLKGINPPIILTDVYPGYFAFFNSNSDQKWGIIEIDMDFLHDENLAPFHGYLEKLGRHKSCKKTDIWKRREKYLGEISKHKGKWRKSLSDCGACLYLSRISPYAINKVSIYSPFEAVEKTITKELAKPDPWNHSSKQHKEAYHHNSCLTRWLACRPIEWDDLTGGVKPIISQLKNIRTLWDSLQGRKELDLFYCRGIEKEIRAWWS
jgi:hypothetical protein